MYWALNYYLFFKFITSRFKAILCNWLLANVLRTLYQVLRTEYISTNQLSQPHIVHRNNGIFRIPFLFIFIPTPDHPHFSQLGVTAPDEDIENRGDEDRRLPHVRHDGVNTTPFVTIPISNEWHVKIIGDNACKKKVPWKWIECALWEYAVHSWSNSSRGTHLIDVILSARKILAIHGVSTWSRPSYTWWAHLAALPSHEIE